MSQPAPIRTESASTTHDRFQAVQQQLEQGFLEVATMGLSLRLLLAVYVVYARSAWGYTVDSLRGLLGMTPVH